MNYTLLNLILALLTNELLHNVIEIMSVREKVKRLDAYSSGRKWKEMKLNIDTRTKSYSLSLVGLIVVVLPLWGLFMWLSFSLYTALKYGIIVLVLTYWLTAIGLDKYHVEIERITRRYMKK